MGFKDSTLRLRQERTARGLEPADIAYMLGVDLSEYTAFEEGRTEMPLPMLLKMCRFFQMDPEVFLQVPQKKETTDTFFEQHLRRKKGVTPTEAMNMLAANGVHIDETTARQVLDTLYFLAELSLDQIEEETRLNARLEEHPEGFTYERDGFTCPVCHDGSKNGWYDRHGLRCVNCQQAITDGIIPPEVCKDQDLYYSDFELERHFALSIKQAKQLTNKGKLLPRIIPAVSKRHAAIRLFLIADNKNFLPPKDQLGTKAVRKYGVAPYMREDRK